MTPRRPIPLWLKIAYTAFMAVLIPVYWYHYGPTNFLYFCDLALLLTLVGIWREDALLISLPTVGILIPQVLWCADFAVQLTGHNLMDMTAYMFDEKRSLFLRGLSFFHGWLPFLLVYLISRTGYDRRALPLWTGIAWAACLVSFFFLPPAGAILPNPKTPVNVNYVFGLSDAAPQTLMAPGLYLVVWMLVLLVVAFIPTHFILKKWFTRTAPAHSGTAGQ